ncbi:hypothetical protein [Glutamicibacter sp.]|jgi:hypothetical protein|uniref:hypothetical protein n=1 Tax=Glutamicibacter sp. TaxID=1931995 RepID=UPI002FD88C02
MPDNQTDLDTLLADAERAGLEGNGANGAPNGAAPAETPESQPPALSGEVEIPRVGKVKIADLAAAYGRQGSLQKQLQAYSQHKDLLDRIAKDPDLKVQILQALDEEEAERASPRRQPETDDDGRVQEPDISLRDRNPLEYFTQMNAFRKQEHDDLKLKYAEQAFAAEEKSVREKFKLDDKQLREVLKVAQRYHNANGEPIELETAVHIWKAPQREKEVTDLKGQLNLRSSGIPGGRINAELSRKKPEEMTEVEREAAMLQSWYTSPGAK